MFDIPEIVKAFASDTNLLTSYRDNIIQGFGFKAGIAHFCKYGLLNMDFMKLGNKIIRGHDNHPRMIYYGVSQGGILGSSYSTLLGPSKLLDGAILVSPASPFSLLMSRSIIFPLYDQLMLFNLLHNRQVRIFISLMQMFIDPVEVGGILSTTNQQDRVPTLIHCGIGDPTVTSIGTEVMARNYGSAMFSNNPHQVYGLPIVTDDEADEVKSLLTEVLYEAERDALPTSNVNVAFNPVHQCVPSDSTLLLQFKHFINTGTFVDVCPLDGCIRGSSWERWEKDHCK